MGTRACVVTMVVTIAAGVAVAQPSSTTPTPPPTTSEQEPPPMLSAPPTDAPLPAVQPLPPQEAVSPGWAHGAAIVGFASAGVIAALTVGVVLQNSPDTADTARAIGGLAIVYAGVALPVVAIGGHSARHHHLVRGVPGLRIAAWVGYGLTMADAVTLLALSFDNEISNLQIVSVGFLGALSSLAFALDANASAAQAHIVNTMSVQPGVQPAVGLLRTADHETVPTLTLTGRF